MAARAETVARVAMAAMEEPAALAQMEVLAAMSIKACGKRLKEELLIKPITGETR